VSSAQRWPSLEAPAACSCSSPCSIRCQHRSRHCHRRRKPLLPFRGGWGVLWVGCLDCLSCGTAVLAGLWCLRVGSALVLPCCVACSLVCCARAVRCFVRFSVGVCWLRVAGGGCCVWLRALWRSSARVLPALLLPCCCLLLVVWCALLCGGPPCVRPPVLLVVFVFWLVGGWGFPVGGSASPVGGCAFPVFGCLLRRAPLFAALLSSGCLLPVACRAGWCCV
jgi:hypothetical protein